jgi:hypothetical protein
MIPTREIRTVTKPNVDGIGCAKHRAPSVWRSSAAFAIRCQDRRRSFIGARIYRV